MDSTTPVTIGPGEEKGFVAITELRGLTTGKRVLSRFDFELRAKCGCGGDLRRLGKKMVWVCTRSRWWNRKKHAYLRVVASVEEIK